MRVPFLHHRRNETNCRFALVAHTFASDVCVCVLWCVVCFLDYLYQYRGICGYVAGQIAVVCRSHVGTTDSQAGGSLPVVGMFFQILHPCFLLVADEYRAMTHAKQVIVKDTAQQESNQQFTKRARKQHWRLSCLHVESDSRNRAARTDFDSQT